MFGKGLLRNLGADVCAGFFLFLCSVVCLCVCARARVCVMFFYRFMQTTSCTSFFPSSHPPFPSTPSCRNFCCFRNPLFWPSIRDRMLDYTTAGAKICHTHTHFLTASPVRVVYKISGPMGQGFLYTGGAEGENSA